MYSVESRFVIGPSDLLFAGVKKNKKQNNNKIYTYIQKV